MRSLKIILDKKPSIIFPGHGNIIEDPLPKIQYYIDHRNKRENQLLEILRSHPERSFNELQLVEIIYVDTPKELWPAAAYNVNHHLKKLTKENAIEELVENDGSVWRFRTSANL